MKANEFKQFIDGAFHALLWSTSINEKECYADELPISDENKKEILAAIATNSLNFFRKNYDELKDYCDLRLVPMNYAGHDYTMEVSDTGVGFTDRELGKLGEQLSENCQDEYDLSDLIYWDDENETIAIDRVY